MRLPSSPTVSVVDHLNKTYFNQVWNAPDDHGRSNFHLNKAAERIQTGAVPVGLSVVGLPTTDAVYAVYETGYRGFSRFAHLPNDQWVTDTSIAAKYGVSIIAFGGNGRVCPSGSVYLRYMSLKDKVLVAIDKNYTSKCVGSSFPDLWITVYKDTSRNTPIISQVFTVNSNVAQGTPSATVTTAITNAKTSYPNGTTVMVNGWVYDPNHVPSLVNGDVVNIVSDPDIIGYCDITVDDNLTGYYSDLYEEYREILHVPKALNPNNYIITHDTLTTVVFDTATNKGVLGHRVNINALESISHNDFSMGRTALQGFSQSLGANNIIVRLYIRYATEPNLLTEDVNRLKDLYSLSDTEIKNQLLGVSSKQLEEWKASNLEQSPFLTLLYNLSGFPTDTAIAEYTEAMGYYDVASVLGQQMRFYTYRGAQVEIIKPVRLNGIKCQALVYANGRKIREDAFVISDYKSTSFLLGFKTSANVTIGDRISVYIIEEGWRAPLVYNPTSGSPSITLDNEDYTLVRVFTYSSPKAVQDKTVTKGYQTIPFSPGDYTITLNTDGTYKLQVRDQHFGHNFYVVPKFGIDTGVYDLGDTITDKKPFIIDLMTTADNDDVIPLTVYESMEVYINGFRLIEGLDYRCSVIEGDNNDDLQNLLVVSNYDYIDFESGNNVLEVVTHGDKVASEDKGYAISNLLYRTSIPMIYTKSSSRIFVHGKLIENIAEAGNIITTSSNVENGAPFLVQYNLAYGSAKLMSAISPSEDISLRSKVDRILGIVVPTYPSNVVVNHLYALYSPFLGRIVHDVGSGLFTIVDEPRDDRFLRQFSVYKNILERDPTVGPANDLIDRRFVTLGAHYTNYGVSDAQQMLRLQRLIDLVLTPSELTIDQVLL